MTDYISREAYIDRIEELHDAFLTEKGCLETDMDNGLRLGLERAMMEADNFPAADVREVKRGKWISMDGKETVVKMKYGEPQNSCKCSVCGEWLVASDEYAVIGNFCPNCGADMREEQT